MKGNSLVLSTSRKLFSRATPNHCHLNNIFHGSAQYVSTEHRLLSAEKPLVQTASLGEGSNNQRHSKSRDAPGSLA